MADTAYKIVGSRPVRPDASDKVTGKANYGADFSLPGMLCGKVLRSEHTHARILGIDVSGALAIEGVKAAVVANDFSFLQPGGMGDLVRDNFAHEKVLYHGHAVAAVAATTPVLADQALAAIKVEYEVLTPVMTLDDAMRADAVILHDHVFTQGVEPPPGTPSNIYMRDEQRSGNISKGFEEADEIIEREFSTPMVHQGYIEPPACLATYSENAQSTLWSTTQGHFPLRESVARMMQMNEASLKVIPTEVGGAFGGKTAVYHEAIAMMLSKKAGRPVKMQMSREDIFRSAGPGSGSICRVKIGARKDGTITAMSARLVYDSGAFPGAPLAGGMRSVFSAYDVANVFVEGYAVFTNKPKVRAYRGPGAPQANLATESVINELSERIGMDPIEFRLKNAVREGSTTAAGTFRKIGLEECLIAAKNSAHYQSALKPNQGRGLAVGFWKNGAGVSSAAIHMNSDGTASLATGSVDLSGTRIALAMIAAEELQIPVADISSVVVDTESITFTGNSAGSRTINATGHAVVGATRHAIEQMKQRAASGWNVTPDQITWQDGKAVNNNNGDELTIKEICRTAPSTGGPITGKDSLEAVLGLGPSFSLHICDAEVDPDTGKVSITRYTTVQDAGTAIHRDAVEGQMQGGAVQGIGWALNEEFIYNRNGVLENPGFLDYRIPLASDLPMIETIVVEVPNELHPYGVRGVGEAPIIPPLAAVASAVSNAIGVRVTELPCSPPRILAAIEKKMESK
ncbi:MAG: xanthine dehydrogenase family protein molybdopterin-binding subunit [Gammaproteobacteria bacterium]|nr:xanthine dehydrogenase family protein molybdopterin-binding subunit [Gammaproteobacteria bacterium]